MVVIVAVRIMLRILFSNFVFPPPNKTVRAVTESPLHASLSRSPILIQWFTKDTDPSAGLVSPSRIITGREPVTALWATSSIWIS